MSLRPHRSDDIAPARRVGRPAGPTSQGAASRDVIIDAAAGVFARLGYDRARMVDIVEASGLSKGAVYFHFDSKEALAVAVLEERHRRWLADVERIVAQTPSGEPRIRRLLPAMLSLHDEHSDAWVISRLTQSLADATSTRDLAAAMTQRWIDVVAELIRDAPLGADLDPDALATVLVGAFDGLKVTVDVVSAGDRDSARRLLAERGALLERMLFQAIGLTVS
ncbi:TetR/AcrR family transcriptional regulator [Microbacterium sp. Clip185]|uniref:TetR/AcrR family transcriptional regulator n=1 Tax=Microbacterium sp. Clip185 TaxID=3025663 RepID=UPI002365420D|nr:TetR/AcrR family transcriptional regulator [Microbacterium sp. Clip185]WDG19256.1 TetR/AcrR family transcriptional regulator [Microbacterium sp. Clip185]